MKNICTRIRSFLCRFRRVEAGVAYLEFALATPLLMGLLMGSIEITRYILIAQKVEKTAVTVADVVSQSSTISTSDLNNIIYAASQVMQPYSFGDKGYVIISSVTQTGASSAGNPPKVNWQYTSSGANGSMTKPSVVGTPGTVATLPPGFTLYDKDNVIITEIYYYYTPLSVTNGVINNVLLYKTGLFKPRLGALATLSALHMGSTKGAVA